MEPQVIPIPAPQAPNFEAPRFDLPMPQQPSDQQLFSEQDRLGSLQGLPDAPPMFFRNSLRDGGFDMFGTLLFLALLFVMFKFFFGGMRHAMLDHGPSRGWKGMKSMRRGWGQDDALELARMRFAKGEISSEEFEMIQRALKD
jgi:uncharacterized membrane protein